MLVTRDQSKCAGDIFLTFKVYRSPHDGKTIFGYREFSYALSDGKVMYQRTPDGVRVTTAFIEALDFASDSGIFAIWIDDPKELFDMALSQ